MEYFPQPSAASDLGATLCFECPQPAFLPRDVRKTWIPDLMGDPNFGPLVEEYADECATAGLPRPDAKMSTYEAMEHAGILHAFSASEDGRLIGFITVLATDIPHYGMSVAVSESFFVGKAHRHTLAGLRLLTAAEQLTADICSPGLFVSAPMGGDLFKVLPRCGYTETNRVFFKQVAHG